MNLSVFMWRRLNESTCGWALLILRSLPYLRFDVQINADTGVYPRSVEVRSSVMRWKRWDGGP